MTISSIASLIRVYRDRTPFVKVELLRHEIRKVQMHLVLTLPEFSRMVDQADQDLIFVMSFCLGFLADVDPVNHRGMTEIHVRGPEVVGVVGCAAGIGCEVKF